ncbi:class I SAM-dependent methyltransferase [Aquamicrobium sp. LC103]|uniref:class I SAM-dependent methyltransferase n=1 Tax=Aquamicrobium sp. LC103 TaxID=1120658 RepID=UPI0032B23766
MSEGHARTLFHPFEAEMLPLPWSTERVLIFNPPPGFRAPTGFRAALFPVQDFRPFFLDLVKSGYPAASEASGDGYDLALVLCGRHRGQNELWVADALRRVKPGSRVVIAGGKTEGAASLRKRLGGLMEIEGHASKHHGVVFWLTRSDDLAAASALEAANPAMLVEGRFRTAPGMFSHDRVDAGSRLLAGNLPADIKGAVADFGAGWGYLSVRVAERAAGLSALDLYEAGFTASEAAKANLAVLAPDVPARVFWHDLLSEKVERRYDLVVMNPPFHQGRAAEPSIGERMIQTASAALKPGGRLLLVANRPLPYEAVLQAKFARHGEICRDERFKILWAIR